MPYVTVFGCSDREGDLFRSAAARLGLRLTITAAAATEETVALAAGGRCVSIDHRTTVTNATLLALRRAGVGYISTRSIGYNHLDVRYARRLGLAVGNVSYSPGSVADYTLMLILMAIRNAKAVLIRATTNDFRLFGECGRELGDLTVGVIGTGQIGAAVVARLKGFGGQVLAHDRAATADVDYVPLDDLLRRSDIVTLNIPLHAETHHLLDQQRIGLMKPGAVIVNTGRGPLIDTDALICALDGGRLGGAALDVLEGEESAFYTDRQDQPLDGRLQRLQRFPNVIITPHTAFYTDHALRDMVHNSLANCLRFESEPA